MANKQETTKAKTTINEVKIIDYSERAIALVGNTKPIKEQLKKMGGRYNPRLSCGAGWVFSKKAQADVEAYIAKLPKRAKEK